MKHGKRLVFLVFLLLGMACNLLTPGNNPTSLPTPVEMTPAQTAVQLPTASVPTATQPIVPSPTVPSPTVEITQTLVPPTETPAVTMQNPVVLADTKSSPTQLNVLDPVTGKSLAAFTASDFPDYGTSYAIGNYVYYVDSTAKNVFRVDHTGQSLDLKFLNPDQVALSNAGSFLPSPDGKRIAWTNMISFDATGIHYLLIVANIDGTNEKVLLDQTSAFYRIPFAWSNDGSLLYCSNQPYGIGGYILFGGSGDLITINLDSGQQQTIIPEEKKFRPLSLSPDEKTVAMLQIGDTIQLVFHDIVTGGEKSVKLPDGYSQAGSIIWSPDSQTVGLTMAIGEPDHEAFSVILVQTSNLATNVLIKDDPRNFRTITWPVAGTIWLNSDADTTAWMMDATTGALTQSTIPGIIVHTKWD